LNSGILNSSVTPPRDEGHPAKSVILDLEVAPDRLRLGSTSLLFRDASFR
jgi:hypothetical protein